MSALAEAREIVDGLTREQVREACLQFLNAIVLLDADGDVRAFVERMRKASDDVLLMALGVAA